MNKKTVLKASAVVYEGLFSIDGKDFVVQYEHAVVYSEFVPDRVDLKIVGTTWHCYDAPEQIIKTRKAKVWENAAGMFPQPAGHYRCPNEIVRWVEQIRDRIKSVDFIVNDSYSIKSVIEPDILYVTSIAEQEKL